MRLLLGPPDEPRLRLENRLLALFPDLGPALTAGAQGPEIRLASEPLWLVFTFNGEMTRFELGHRDGRTDPVLCALARLLDMGESSFDAMPLPIWRQSGGGQVVWANRAFREALKGDPREAPAPLTPTESSGTARLVRPLSPGEPPRQILITPHGDGAFGIASETAACSAGAPDLKDVVQTLSTTFASLSVGLAVFGRDRRLALFNPALSDLTRIPAASLAAQPTIFDFFDALRTARMAPEPRDFVSWRDHVLGVERAASDGTFRDTWHLASGQVLRVVGRPQAEGALALLFEDITGEIGLTRGLRAQIDTAQAVLDGLHGGVGVFGPDRTLVLSNLGLDRLWGRDTMGTPEPIGLAEFQREFGRRLCENGRRALFGALEAPGEQSRATGRIRLDGALQLRSEVRALGSGMTLLRLDPIRAIQRAGAARMRAGVGAP